MVVPKSWSDVTLLNFKLAFDHNEDDIDFLSFICDCEPEELEDLTVTQFNRMKEELHWMGEYPTKELTRFEDYWPIEFDLMTVGEFVDLESLVDKGVMKNLCEMANILVRKDTIYSGQYYSPIEYVPVTAVYKHVIDFLNWRTELLREFSGLFQSVTKEEDFRGESEAEKRRRLRDEAIELDKTKRWSWFGFIHSLAKGDITKLEECTRMHLRTALNLKLYEKIYKISQ